MNRSSVYELNEGFIKRVKKNNPSSDLKESIIKRIKTELLNNISYLKFFDNDKDKRLFLEDPFDIELTEVDDVMYVEIQLSDVSEDIDEKYDYEFINNHMDRIIGTYFASSKLLDMKEGGRKMLDRFTIGFKEKKVTEKKKLNDGFNLLTANRKKATAVDNKATDESEVEYTRIVANVDIVMAEDEADIVRDILYELDVEGVDQYQYGDEAEFIVVIGTYYNEVKSDEAKEEVRRILGNSKLVEYIPLDKWSIKIVEVDAEGDEHEIESVSLMYWFKDDKLHDEKKVQDSSEDESSLVETIGDYTIKKNNDDFLKFAVFYKGQIIAETTTVSIAKRQIKQHMNDTIKPQILSQLAKHFKDRFNVFIFGNNVEISSDTVASSMLFDEIYRKNIFGKLSNDHMSAPYDEDFVLLKLDKMKIGSLTEYADDKKANDRKKLQDDDRIHEYSFEVDELLAQLIEDGRYHASDLLYWFEDDFSGEVEVEYADGLIIFYNLTEEELLMAEELEEESKEWLKEVEELLEEDESNEYDYPSPKDDNQKVLNSSIKIGISSELAEMIEEDDTLLQRIVAEHFTEGFSDIFEIEYVDKLQWFSTDSFTYGDKPKLQIAKQNLIDWEKEFTNKMQDGLEEIHYLRDRIYEYERKGIGSEEEYEAWKVKLEQLLDMEDEEDKHIYEFPELTDKDKEVLEDYNLTYLGHEGENCIVEGYWDDLDDYTFDYLGYEMNPDHLHEPGEFDRSNLDKKMNDERREITGLGIQLEIEVDGTEASAFIRKLKELEKEGIIESFEPRSTEADFHETEEGSYEEVFYIDIDLKTSDPNSLSSRSIERTINNFISKQDYSRIEFSESILIDYWNDTKEVSLDLFMNMIETNKLNDSEPDAFILGKMIRRDVMDDGVSFEIDRTDNHEIITSLKESDIEVTKENIRLFKEGFEFAATEREYDEFEEIDDDEVVLTFTLVKWLDEEELEEVEIPLPTKPIKVFLDEIEFDIEDYLSKAVIDAGYDLGVEVYLIEWEAKGSNGKTYHWKDQGRGDYYFKVTDSKKKAQDENIDDKKYIIQKDIATEILELIEVYYGDIDYGEMVRVGEFIIFYFLDDLTIEELNELDVDHERLLEIAAQAVEEANIKFKVNDDTPVHKALDSNAGSALDNWLQDVAQMTGEITYNDIKKVNQTNIKEIKKLRREWSELLKEDPEAEDELFDIGKRIKKALNTKMNDSTSEGVTSKLRLEFHIGIEDVHYVLRSLTNFIEKYSDSRVDINDFEEKDSLYSYEGKVKFKDEDESKRFERVIKHYINNNGDAIKVYLEPTKKFKAMDSESAEQLAERLLKEMKEVSKSKEIEAIGYKFKGSMIEKEHYLEDNELDKIIKLAESGRILLVHFRTTDDDNPYAQTYRMLSRLKQDVLYFLGNGNRSEKYLWALNVEDHIAEMRKHYDELPEGEKPEWLTEEDINQFEKEMTSKPVRKLRVAKDTNKATDNQETRIITRK